LTHQVSAPAPTQGGPWDRFFGERITADPTFVDPSASERLKILVAMLYAFNGLKTVGSLPPRDMGRPKQGQRWRPGQSGPKHIAMPTMEQFRAWFRKLSYRERVAIDWRFNDRARYTELFREGHKDWKPGDPPPHWGVWKNDSVETFKDPEDVFISPRDGKPFVMGEHFVDDRTDGHDHSWPYVFWEKDGVDAVDGRFLERHRARMVVNLAGFTGSTLDDIRSDSRDMKRALPPRPALADRALDPR
jgi:hypothetical protein